MTCRACRYFDDRISACRRSAPAPVARLENVPLSDDTAYWPIVLPDEWCGEFEATGASK